jgi:hypothetical protein
MGIDVADALRSEYAAVAAPTCWLCDRSSGELCHVHESCEPDGEPAPVVLTLNVGDQ